MAHIAESTHWYNKNGLPAYEVPRAKGDGMRATTLRDARIHGYVPSVTSVIKCAAAPGLENWKQQQVLLAALTLPRNPDEPEKEWLDRVMLDSREQARKAAEKGTAIHAAIQGHYEGKAPASEYWEFVKSATAKVEAHFGKRIWTVESSFAHPLGFGGKTDLFTQGIVIDFKTKEFYDDTKKLAWDEHAIQLAAYREGLGMPDAICANVFVSTVKSNLAVCHVWGEADIQSGWKMFTSLLSYWQAKNKYWP